MAASGCPEVPFVPVEGTDQELHLWVGTELREATAHLMNSRLMGACLRLGGARPALVGLQSPLNPGNSAYNQAVVWGTSDHVCIVVDSPPDCTSSLVCSRHSVTPLGAY